MYNIFDNIEKALKDINKRLETLEKLSDLQREIPEKVINQDYITEQIRTVSTIQAQRAMRKEAERINLMEGKEDTREMDKLQEKWSKDFLGAKNLIDEKK